MLLNQQLFVMQPAVKTAVPGLTYVREFLPPQEHDELLVAIDDQPWISDLQRRVQHYGYRYDYKAHRIDASMRVGPLPAWAVRLACRLYDQGITPRIPDQLIVNEYRPGQGIARHVDCLPCFDDTIVSITLGSTCAMVFTHPDGSSVPVLLEPRSAVVLQGDTRRVWRHEIPKRKKDVIGDQTYLRSRRVSLTFRKVILF